MIPILQKKKLRNWEVKYYIQENTTGNYLKWNSDLLVPESVMTIPCYRYDEIIFQSTCPFLTHSSLVDVNSPAIFLINTFLNFHGMQDHMDLSAGLHVFLNVQVCVDISVLFGGTQKHVISEWAHLGSSCLLTHWRSRKQGIRMRSCGQWYLGEQLLVMTVWAEQLEGRADVSNNWERVMEIRQWRDPWQQFAPPHAAVQASFMRRLKEF